MIDVDLLIAILRDAIKKFPKSEQRDERIAYFRAEKAKLSAP